MAFSFFPLDNEWASATGSNVYSGGNSSQFDYPPHAMFNMEITPDPSDPDPRTFEIGDTVDLSYSVVGINVTLDDATVIRSDAAPDGGGIIVFEGTNNFGQIEHLVWTPDFDLESWYWDNFTGMQPPSFWISDTNPGYVHKVVCFSADTALLTPQGWIPAGEIRAGAHIMTLDHGVAAVRHVHKKTVTGCGQAAPVEFLPGAMGNQTTVRLSQQHRVLIKSARAELLFGHSEVFVPAKALVNRRDIRLAPCRSVEYVHILMERHEVLNATGLLCESLLFGDMATDIIGDQIDVDAMSNHPMKSARPILTFREAVHLNSQAIIAPNPRKLANLI